MIDNPTNEKPAENGIKMKILQEVRAHFCTAALLAKTASSMDDVMETEALIKVANRNFDGISREQMKWLIENHRFVKKVVKQFIKEKPWEEQKEGGRSMLAILKSARYWIEDRRKNITREAKKRKIKDIANRIKGRISAIVTPTPREEGDPVLREMMDNHSNEEVASQETALRKLYLSIRGAISYLF